jgi:hypothetical protein
MSELAVTPPLTPWITPWATALTGAPKPATNSTISATTNPLLILKTPYSYGTKVQKTPTSTKPVGVGVCIKRKSL